MTDKAIASDAVIAAMHDFLLFFASAILSALCVGLIAAAAAYLVRPLVGKANQYFSIRSWALARLTRKDQPGPVLPEWLAKAIAGNGLLAQAKIAEGANLGFAVIAVDPAGARRRALAPIPEARLLSTALQDGLLMHSMQNAAKTVVARPPENEDLFAILAADAPPDARGTAYAFARIAAIDPATATGLAEFKPPPADGISGSSMPPNASAAALATTESLIAAAVQRALDELQLSLLKKAIWWNRLVCVAIGIVLAVVAQSALGNGHSPIFIAIGAAGGAVALVLGDAVAWYAGRLAR